MMRRFLFMLVFLSLASCRQMIDAVNMKQYAPEIVESGSRRGGWYEYMPEYAPYFCLKTSKHIIFHDPEMQLGYWRAKHPLPPHRVMMEARGESLILHRSFVWDGESFGGTVKEELLPSLLHDALYFALQGKAPFPRREADQAYLRACRQAGLWHKYPAYLGVRIFGGLFGTPPGAQPPIIETTTPANPPAPLEPDEGKGA